MHPKHIVCFIGCLLFALPEAQANKPVHSLTSKKIKIRTWNEIGEPFWLSNNELLIFRELIKSGSPHLYAYKYNILASKETEIKGLRKHLSAEVPMEGISVSPDHKEIAWTSYVDTVVSVDLNGNNYREQAIPGAGKLMWLRDQTGWLRIERWTEDGNTSGTIIINKSTDKIKHYSLPKGKKFHFACRFLVSPTNTFIVVEPPFTVTRPSINDISISKFSIDSQLTPIDHYQVSLPWQRELYDFAISPSCKYILWQLKPTSRNDVHELWLSSIDGKNMQKLDDVAKPSIIHANEIAWYPYSLQWLPDENAVSFICDGHLWKIQIPKDHNN